MRSAILATAWLLFLLLLLLSLLLLLLMTHLAMYYRYQLVQDVHGLQGRDDAEPWRHVQGVWTMSSARRRRSSPRRGRWRHRTGKPMTSLCQVGIFSDVLLTCWICIITRTISRPVTSRRCGRHLYTEYHPFDAHCCPMGTNSNKASCARPG